MAPVKQINAAMPTMAVGFLVDGSHGRLVISSPLHKESDFGRKDTEV